MKDQIENRPENLKPPNFYRGCVDYGEQRPPHTRSAAELVRGWRGIKVYRDSDGRDCPHCDNSGGLVVPGFNQGSQRRAAMSTEARVIIDIADRQRKGVAKYGVSTEQNPLPLRDWLQHAYEEALDMAVYLKRAIEEIDREERQ